jgi:VanZ family protein
MGWWRATPMRPFGCFLAAAITLVWAAVVSTSVEFLQVWSPRRVASLSDVAAQLVGATIGIAAWLMTGPRLNRWAASLRQSKRPIQRLELVLRAYFLGFLFLSLTPFDVTIHPGDLWEKFQSGRIVLAPFSNFELDSTAVFKLLLDVLLAIPLGMLAVTVCMRPPVYQRDYVASVLVTVGLFAFIEAAQLFVYSRFTQVSDVIVGTVGGSIGVGLGHRIFNPGLSGNCSIIDAPARLWAALALIYVVFPCVVLWWPLNFDADPDMIKSKVRLLAELPLDQLLMKQSFLRTLSQMIERTLLFLPLGLLVGLSIMTGFLWAPVRPRTALALGIGIVLTIAASIEAGQLFLPTRIPDLADVILATAGGALGIVLCQAILGRRRLPLEVRRRVF